MAEAQQTAPWALLPFEQILLDQLNGLSDSESRSLGVAPKDNSATEIRGTFLRWIVLEAIPASRLPIAHLQVTDAMITGELNFENATFSQSIRFERCAFLDNIKLNDATSAGMEFVACEIQDFYADRLTANGSLRITKSRDANNQQPSVRYLRLCGAKIKGNLDLRGCQVGPPENPAGPCLFADGLVIEGNALFIDGFISRGEIRINGSKINRNLDCSGATILHKEGYSLSAAGAEICGSVYLSETKSWSDAKEEATFRSEGTVRLSGARIHGHLDLDQGRFVSRVFASESQTPPSPLVAITTDSRHLAAVAANGVSIGADLNLNGTDISGAVSLIGAVIGGDLNASKTRFDFAGQEPLAFDSIVVHGEAFFDDISTNGLLRFSQATFKQGLRFQNIALDPSSPQKYLDSDFSAQEDVGGPACGVYAANIDVAGTLYWRSITTTAENKPQCLSWLYLYGSKCGKLEDDIASWQCLDRFDVTGFVFTTLANPPNDIKRRLHELDRQYATSTEGWPARIGSLFRSSPVSFRDAGLETQHQLPLIKQ